MEGFGYFVYKGESKASIITYFSNLLRIHRTKGENAKEFLDMHKDDIFRFPNKDERSRLGELKTINYINIEDCEISLCGLGFISFFGKGDIEVVTYDKIGVSKRSQLI